MKKISIAVTLILVLSIGLTGCSKPLAPKDAFKKMQENSQMESTFQVHEVIKLNFENHSTGASKAQIDKISKILNNTSFSVDGVFQRKPLHAEYTLNINITGDVSVNLKIPIIVNNKKIWIKIPDTSIIPLPPKYKGKYIEIDMNSTASSDNQQIAGMMKKSLSKYFDEKTYFKRLDVKNIDLPKNIKPKYAYQLEVTKNQSDEALKTLLTQVVPELIDQLNNPQYLNTFKIKASNLQTIKDSLSKPENTKKIMDIIKINDFKLLDASDSNYHALYQDVYADISAADTKSQQSLRFKLDIRATRTNVNQKVDFKLSIPTKEQSVIIPSLSNLSKLN